jgi:hypothetical protein
MKVTVGTQVNWTRAEENKVTGALTVTNLKTRGGLQVATMEDAKGTLFQSIVNYKGQELVTPAV